MDIDFHYYATYAAALLAGFDNESAEKIAISSQMVDECTFGILHSDSQKKGYYSNHIYIQDKSSSKNIIEYKIQQTMEAGHDTLLSSRGTERKLSPSTIAGLWSVYHFLPGNFDFNDEQYKSDRFVKRSPKKSLKDNDKSNFVYLCRPHSPMAIKIINDCVKFKDETIKNYLIGVTMHVFADTWAHQDFIGIVSPEINGFQLPKQGSLMYWEVKDTVYGDNINIVDGVNKEYYIIEVLKAFVEEKKENNKNYRFEIKEIDWSLSHGLFTAFNYANAFTLGHAQADHLPDLSWINFVYIPSWSESGIMRLNPFIYIDAFANMIYALECIRKEENYKPLSFRKASSVEYYKKACLFFTEITYKNKGLTPFGENKSILSGFSNNRLNPLQSLMQTAFSTLIKDRCEKWHSTINAKLSSKVGDGNFQEFKMPHSWIEDAKKAINADNKDMPTCDLKDFFNLDFFKFNIATKIHYNHVKENIELMMPNKCSFVLDEDSRNNVNINEISALLKLNRELNLENTIQFKKSQSNNNKAAENKAVEINNNFALIYDEIFDFFEKNNNNQSIKLINRAISDFLKSKNMTHRYIKAYLLYIKHAYDNTKTEEYKIKIYSKPEKLRSEYIKKISHIGKLVEILKKHKYYECPASFSECLSYTAEKYLKESKNSSQASKRLANEIKEKRSEIFKYERDMIITIHAIREQKDMLTQHKFSYLDITDISVEEFNISINKENIYKKTIDNFENDLKIHIEESMRSSIPKKKKGIFFGSVQEARLYGMLKCEWPNAIALYDMEHEKLKL